MSKKFTAAALAGLLSASIMTAGVAYANDHDKASCKGKDKAVAEKAACKGKHKGKHHAEKASCTGKVAAEKASCAAAERVKTKDGASKNGAKDAERHANEAK